MRLFACLLFVLLLLALPCCAGAQILHVSPAGDDAAEGSAHAPLASLAEAFLRLEGIPKEEHVTIQLQDGLYRLSEPLSLTHRSRGNFTVCAAPGEVPIITGDVPITGWTEAFLCGEPVWAAPFAADELRAVYGEHGALQNARWPKAGMLSVAQSINPNANQFTSQRAFFADPADLPETLDGAHVRLMHWWKDELSGVKRYDPKSGRITLNRSSAMTIAAGEAFWLENLLSAPLSPGEWAFDSAAGILYYAPRAGETPGDTVLYAGALDRLLSIESLSGITFDGITFARTGWRIPLRDSSTDFPQAAVDADAAIYLRKVKDITFTGCTFADIGAGCIRFDPSIANITISDCLFENIGAQALYFRGKNTDDAAGRIHRVTISNNHVSGYGRNFYNAPAVLIIHAADMDIAHNEIHDGTYTAISAGWVWGTGYNSTDAIRITDNLLYDIGQGLLSDMGGVYTLGVQKNTVISGNVIHDVHAATYGGWGIYLDEGASGILVENNLAHHCSSQGFHQHNGVRNTVRNNIFAYNAMGQVGTSDKRAGGTFLLEGNLLVGEEPFFWRKYEKERIDEGENLFYTDSSPFVDLYGGSFWLADDPAFAGIDFQPWENTAGRR